MKMKDRAKDVAAGAAAGATAFFLRKIFDRAARKRPNGLVGRFRRFFGLENEADREAAHREMLATVQKAVDEYKKK